MGINRTVLILCTIADVSAFKDKKSEAPSNLFGKKISQQIAKLVPCHNEEEKRSRPYPSHAL
jgi:hypothetical protein